MIGPQRWAEKYLTIPFVDRGFDFKGCHCWGLVRLVYEQERKITLPKFDTITAADIKATNQAIKLAIITGPWYSVKTPEPFDVEIMLGWDEGVRGRIERHIGVYASPKHLLHIEKGINATIAKTTNMLMAARMRGTYRYRA